MRGGGLPVRARARPPLPPLAGPAHEPLALRLDRDRRRVPRRERAHRGAGGHDRLPGRHQGQDHRRPAPHPGVRERRPRHGRRRRGGGAPARPVPGVRSATPFVLQQALFTVRAAGPPAGCCAGSTSTRPRCARPSPPSYAAGSLDRSSTGGEPAILLGPGAGPHARRDSRRQRHRDLAAGRDDRGGPGAQDAALPGGRLRRGGHVRVRLLARLYRAGRRPGVRGAGRPRDRRGGQARRSVRGQDGGPADRRRGSALPTGCATGWT